jgi:serine/threonine protein kinase/WD40 repeat protein
VASPGELDDADLFDFVDEFQRDREKGRELPLAHYLRRYPGHEEAIAREFLRLNGELPAPKPASLPAQESAASASAQDGERHIGPYRLLRELGAGGQGAVWLAEDTRIERQVALKFMPSSFALLSADRRRRFQREAEVVSRLEHPSICPVYEAQVEHDPPYIAMRAVDGETLASAIARARTSGRRADETLPLPPRTPTELRRVLAYFERTARALHAAHEAGVVHRDIKPGNLMVTRAGEPVILDFGQARDEHAELHERTLSGEVFGTPTYMSPEQIAGVASGVDARTDVWSLGASLYEALTLHRPFLGESVAALLQSIRSEPLPNPRGRGGVLDEDTAVVLETALEKDLARRYASSLELAEDLRRIREYEPIRARPASPLLKLRRWAQRHPALAVALSGVLISLAGAAWLAKRENEALEREGAAQLGRTNALQRELEARKREDAALDNVLGRYLAMRSADLLAEDPAAALSLGLRAVERAPGYATRSALFAALEQCWLDQVLMSPTNQIVLDVDLSSDGVRAVGALNDGTACVWNLATRCLELTVHAAPKALELLRVDPRSRWFVAATSEPALVFASLTDGQPLGRIDGLDAPWATLALSPADGSVIALARNGRGLILDGDSRQPRATLALEPERYNRVVPSPDGRVLLVSSAAPARPRPLRSEVALLLDAHDGRELARLVGHSAAITDSDIAADSRTAVTCSLDGTLRLWSLPDGRELAPALGPVAPLSTVRFTRDGLGLVTGSESGEAANGTLLWDLATRTARTLDAGQTDRVQSIDISPHDGSILVASRDPELALLGADGTLQRTLSERLRPVSSRWALGGRRVITHALAPYALVWWSENRPDIYALEGHTGSILSVELSPDGSHALTVSEDGTARLWHTPKSAEERGDWPAGRELARVGDAGARASVAKFAHDGRALVARADGSFGWLSQQGWCELAGRMEGVAVELALEPGGERALARASDGRVVRIDADGSTLVVADAVRALAWLGKGRVAFAREGQRLALLDLERGTTADELTWSSTSPAEAQHLAAHPDGDRVALACADGRLRQFSLSSRGPTREPLDLFLAREVQFAPGGGFLLAIGAAGRGVVRVLDLARDKPVPDRVMHTAALTDCDLHPSLELALTSSRDQSVYVRSVATGEPVARRTDFRSPVTCAAFSRDGGEPRVISGCADGRVHVWPVDPTSAARARRPRELFDWELEREKRFAAPLPFR